MVKLYGMKRIVRPVVLLSFLLLTFMSAFLVFPNKVIAAGANCTPGILKVTIDTNAKTAKVDFDGSKASGFTGTWFLQRIDNLGSQNNQSQLTKVVSLLDGTLAIPGGDPFNPSKQQTFTLQNISSSTQVNIVGLGGESPPQCAIVFTDDARAGTGDGGVVEGVPDSFSLCAQANPSDLAKCQACSGNDANVRKIWTAFGCIQTDAPGMVKNFLTIGLGLSGGIVLLSILAGALMLATSAGEPKKVQQAQEMISSAVMGLLFVVFSIVILQFVGVSILHIPGFGT